MPIRDKLAWRLLFYKRYYPSVWVGSYQNGEIGFSLCVIESIPKESARGETSRATENKLLRLPFAFKLNTLYCTQSLTWAATSEDRQKPVFRAKGSRLTLAFYNVWILRASTVGKGSIHILRKVNTQRKITSHMLLKSNPQMRII